MIRPRPILAMLLVAFVLCALGAAGVGGYWTSGTGVALCAVAFVAMLTTGWR